MERGESVGIIGDNGSGKSTLLKVISKILRPTGGSVEVNGRITPFLELGVGFSPDLTARENIEVYSTIMGLSEKEIAKNIDSVLEFAGLTKFRDTKLKNFSSGMQVRLAFAPPSRGSRTYCSSTRSWRSGTWTSAEVPGRVQRVQEKRGHDAVRVARPGAVRRFCDSTLL